MQKEEKAIAACTKNAIGMVNAQSEKIYSCELKKGQHIKCQLQKGFNRERMLLNKIPRGL